MKSMDHLLYPSPLREAMLAVNAAAYDDELHSADFATRFCAGNRVRHALDAAWKILDEIEQSKEQEAATDGAVPDS